MAKVDITSCPFTLDMKYIATIGKKFPISNDVIQRVEEMAAQENQPIMHDKQPIFKWKPGISITSNPENTHTDPDDASIDTNGHATVIRNNGDNNDINDKQNNDDNAVDDISTDASNKQINDEHINIVSNDDGDLSVVINEEQEIFEYEHLFMSEDSNISYDDSLSYSLDLSSPHAAHGTEGHMNNALPEDGM